jgi:aryl-alcohol dehydrogenase-like predicted oxidoreductase
MTGLPSDRRRSISGRAVSSVGLGCMNIVWGYGTTPSEPECARLLDRAIDCGYDHLDTARIYGLGKSEELIGNTLHGRRDRFFLASKTGIRADGDSRQSDSRPEFIRAALEESLRLLRTDHIDLYYLHRRDFTVPIEDSVGALADLIKEGKIGGIGLSEMSAETLRRAHATHPIAAMQTEYSLWTRQVEIAVLDACRELGVTMVAFSPLGRGALGGALRDPAILPDGDMRRTMPRFQGDHWPRNLSALDRFFALAAQAQITPAQLALAWVLSRGEHIVAIPGTTSIPHLEENIATLELAVDPAILARADDIISPKTISGPRYPPHMQQSIDTEEYA